MRASLCIAWNVKPRSNFLHGLAASCVCYEVKVLVVEYKSGMETFLGSTNASKLNTTFCGSRGRYGWSSRPEPIAYNSANSKGDPPMTHDEDETVKTAGTLACRIIPGR